jgi:Icc-related predicted phosphoesterase
MRILAISDKIDPLLYSPAIKRVVGPVDLVLSCGDLPLYYIDYVTSMLHTCCYLVQGNHASGAEFQAASEFGPRRINPMDIHRRVVMESGLLIAGLEGSMRYNLNPRYQYTQSEMWHQVWALAPSLLWNRMRHGRYLDILVAHNPPAGIHDGSDRAHQGFESFLWFMRTFRPRFLLHGHKHVYRHDEVTQTQYHKTTVINVYPWRVIEF